MQPTYTFYEIIEFIRTATTSDEIKNIYAIFQEEQELYSPLYAILIDAGLEAAHQHLSLYELNHDQHDH